MAKPISDVLVLLPGITGSELVKDNRVVWGWSGGALLRNLLTAGEALRSDLRVDADSPTAPILDDGVRATRLLPDLHLLPRVWKVDGYGVVQRHLQDTFGLRLGLNFFPFPYDWRRDNRAAAHRLKSESSEWLRRWREHSGNAEAKLVLVGHSMGGLIARYFIEVLEGWRETRALITLGTPFRGSINAVDSLVNGMSRFGLELTDVARRMYSLHQLLPTYRCCDNGDGTLRPLTDVSLPGIDAQRLENSVSFHKEIADAARRNVEANGSPTYRIAPIVGLNQPTRHTVGVVNGGIALLNTLNGADPTGDGTVPRQSAVPVASDVASATFVSTKHATIQNDAGALAHLTGVISSLYLPDDPFRGRIALSPPVQVSLDVEDIYLSLDPIVISANPNRPGVRLRATVLDGTTDQVLKRAMLQENQDGFQTMQFVPSRSGTYRLVVDGKEDVQPASDVFEVLERE